MGDPRPAGVKIGAHLSTDLDGAPFDSPAPSIDGLGLLELSQWISKVGRQVDLEGGFVALDHKERIRLLRTQEVPEFAVSVQRIKRTDPPGNGQAGKQVAGFGDLVGFFT